MLGAMVAAAAPLRLVLSCPSCYRQGENGQALLAEEEEGEEECLSAGEVVSAEVIVRVV